MTPCPGRISINFPTDERCFRAVLRIAGVQPEDARILRIRNTLAMAQIVASDAYWPEVAARSDLDVLAPLQPWTLDAAGNLDAEADLLHAVQH